MIPMTSASTSSDAHAFNDDILAQALAGNRTAIDEAVRFANAQVRRIVESQFRRFRVLRKTGEVDDVVQTALSDIALLVPKRKPQTTADLLRLAVAVANLQVRLRLHLIAEYPSTFGSEETATALRLDLDDLTESANNRR